MAAKGAIAKETAEKLIIRAFGSDYIGKYDKKLYVWAQGAASKEQVAITITCPKIQRGIEDTIETTISFEDESKPETTFKPAEISPEERKTLEDLMRKVGI